MSTWELPVGCMQQRGHRGEETRWHSHRYEYPFVVVRSQVVVATRHALQVEVATPLCLSATLYRLLSRFVKPATASQPTITFFRLPRASCQTPEPCSGL